MNSSSSSSLLFILLTSCSLALIGCAREPSEVDIKRMVEMSIIEDMSILMKKYLGVNLSNVLGIDQLRVNEIEKISGEPIVSKKITCQVLVDFEFINKKDGLSNIFGGVPRTRKIVEYQFVKLNQGWQVIAP